MDGTTRQFNGLSIHGPNVQGTEDDEWLKRKDMALVRELKKRLTKEYMLAHEPWRGARLSPEYIRSAYSDPPVLFFGIALEATAADVLSMARKLDAPETLHCDEGDPWYLPTVLRNIDLAIRKKLKSPWPIRSWGVISPRTNMTRVMCLTDNNLDSLSHKRSNVDDVSRIRSIRWTSLQDTAKALRELTGREPMWYIGDRVHNDDWDYRAGYSVFGM